MKKTVLITGGLGYLGGRVSKILSKNSAFEVILGDLRQTIESVSRIGNEKIIPIDLASDDDLKKACTNVHSIIHLAAMNEIQCAANPKQAMIVNSVGTLRLVKTAVEQGVTRFIYFSTAHVYGSPLVGKITEKTPTRPVHPYAISKRAGEDFVLSAKDKKELEGIVLRLSNGFGAPATANINRWTLICNDLCRQAVMQRKLVLNSSGLQKRDFVTLHDIGRAIEHLLLMPSDEMNDGLFNLGGELPLRILDLVEMVADQCEEVLGFRPDILRAKSCGCEMLEPLDYRIDKIKQTGFQLTACIDKEIADTLKLCNEVFKK